jgi:hypothetical protein
LDTIDILFTHCRYIIGALPLVVGFHGTTSHSAALPLKSKRFDLDQFPICILGTRFRRPSGSFASHQEKRHKREHAAVASTRRRASAARQLASTGRPDASHLRGLFHHTSGTHVAYVPESSVAPFPWYMPLSLALL